MFKWFKIVKSQYFGFWGIGILLFVIQEIPYMIMPLLHLENNPIMEMPTRVLFLDVLEKILGILSVAVMILVVHKDNNLFSINTKKEMSFFVAAISIIILNFIGWIIYFCGLQGIAVMIIFIFALPPIYYLFIGLWRKNYLLVVVSGLFFIVHLSNAFINLL